jgi:hypothetical protein
MSQPPTRPRPNIDDEIAPPPPRAGGIGVGGIWPDVILCRSLLPAPISAGGRRMTARWPGQTRPSPAPIAPGCGASEGTRP